MRHVLTGLLLVVLALPAILVVLFVLYAVIDMAAHHPSSAHPINNAIKLQNSKLSSM